MSRRKEFYAADEPRALDDIFREIDEREEQIRIREELTQFHQLAERLNHEED